MEIQKLALGRALALHLVSGLVLGKKVDTLKW